MSTHLAQWQVVVILLQEVDVSRGDDAHQLAAHFAVVCYGDSAEAMASFGLEDVSYTLIGAHHHWVCDEALLITLGEEGEGRRRSSSVQQRNKWEAEQRANKSQQDKKRRERIWVTGFSKGAGGSHLLRN